MSCRRCRSHLRAAVLPLALGGIIATSLWTGDPGGAPSAAGGAADAAPLAWVTEAGNSSRVSQRRLEHLRRQSVLHGLPLHVIGQVSQGEDGFGITNQLLVNKLRLAADLCRASGNGSAHDMGSEAEQLVLITEDDVHFHGRFRGELGATIAAMPPTWRALHLCPGYLWGRSWSLGAHLEPGAMRPEGPVPTSDYPRFFRGLSGIVVGGPVAFVVRCKHVGGILSAVLSLRLPLDRSNHADATLLRISSSEDLVAREPQLCTEWPQGGSQLSDGAEVWQSYWGLLLRLALYPLACLVACCVVSAVSSAIGSRQAGGGCLQDD